MVTGWAMCLTAIEALWIARSINHHLQLAGKTTNHDEKRKRYTLCVPQKERERERERDREREREREREEIEERERGR